MFAERSAEAINLTNSKPIESGLPSSQSITETNELLTVEKIDTENAPTMATPAFENTKPQTQELNDILVSSANLRYEKNQLMIDACFDKPDNSDWTIWDVTLKIDDKEIKEYGTSPISNIPAEGGIKGQRCDTVYFGPLSSDTNLSNFTFVVETILAYPNEGEVCTPGFIAKYQEALDARDAGITVECFVEVFEGGGGMSGVRVTDKPESMSLEDADAILYSNDIFLEVHGIQGPWTFNFSLDK